MSPRGRRFDLASRPRGEPLTVWLDDRAVTACAGESVAALLFAEGARALRRGQRDHRPRGYWCGMGVCHECLVTVDGRPGVRACMTEVRDGMCVRTAGGGDGA